MTPPPQRGKFAKTRMPLFSYLAQVGYGIKNCLMASDSKNMNYVDYIKIIYLGAHKLLKKPIFDFNGLND